MALPGRQHLGNSVLVLAAQPRAASHENALPVGPVVQEAVIESSARLVKGPDR